MGSIRPYAFFRFLITAGLTLIVISYAAFELTLDTPDPYKKSNPNFLWNTDSQQLTEILREKQSTSSKDCGKNHNCDISDILTDENTQYKEKSSKFNFEDCEPDPSCFGTSLTPTLKAMAKGKVKPSKKPRTIYLKTIGKMGNIRFEFAQLLALQKAFCVDVKVTTEENVADMFEKVPFDLISKEEFDRRVSSIPHIPSSADNSNYAVVHTTALKQDIEISGVWSSFTAIRGCEDYVIDRLQVKQKYWKKGRQIIDNIVRKSGKRNVTVIGIHASRTEKLDKDHYAMGWRVPNVTYFHKALAYFRKKYPNSIFIAVSDDRKWIAGNFPRSKHPDIYLVPEDVYQVDFSVLSQCDHVIQSLGTDGKWAGFLSRGESTYFRDYQVCQYKRCESLKNYKYKPNNNPFYPRWRPLTEYPEQH